MSRNNYISLGSETLFIKYEVQLRGKHFFDRAELLISDFHIQNLKSSRCNVYSCLSLTQTGLTWPGRVAGCVQAFRLEG